MTYAHTHAPKRPNLWILGGFPDLLLIVLAPLLIMPLFWVAEQQFTVTDIAVFVAAFGALGHHLPGMMRAYGDRALFTRFRTRFIVAPILLAIACVLGVYFNLVILTLVALLWGFWHAVMQVYGFARIYDVKVGSTSRDTARLDLALLACWFSLGLSSSGGHMAGVLSKLHFTGGPLLSATAFATARSGLIALTAVVTAAFLANLLKQSRSGTSASPVKLALMVSSIGVYWYAMVYTPSTLIGIALFEIFHDIQYLTIVWSFSNRIAATDSQANRFSRFLFRRTRPMIALYLMLVGAYGSIGIFIPRLIETGTLHKSINGLIIASALLHFYFDGFIWKVREPSIQAGLDLSIDQKAGHRPAKWFSGSGGTLHALKWGLLLVPVFGFALMQRLEPTTLDQHRAAANAYAFAEPHYKVGQRLADRGRNAEALEHLRKAVRLDPDFAAAHHELGMLLMRTRPLEAIHHFEKVVELEPDFEQSRLRYADALRIIGRLAEAEEQYEIALRLGAGGAQEKLDRLRVERVETRGDAD